MSLQGFLRIGKKKRRKNDSAYKWWSIHDRLGWKCTRAAFHLIPPPTFSQLLKWHTCKACSCVIVRAEGKVNEAKWNS